VAYSGPEYWYVVYKALADFGDLIAQAAAAKTALDGLKQSAQAEGQAETDAATKAAAAHNLDATAIKKEAAAYAELAAAAKMANVQTDFGGRSSMDQHLSDIQREEQYTTLLNRANWLNFNSPQQAFAFKQQQYQQALLMNRAYQMGYATPDQYINFLQRETSAQQAMNAQTLARVGLYKNATDAALAYSDAMSGTHQSISELGGSSLASINALNDAITNLPDTSVTEVDIDETHGIQQLDDWTKRLREVPRTMTTQEVIVTAQKAGGVPIHPGVSQTINENINENINVNNASFAEREMAAIGADMATLRRIMQAPLPPVQVNVSEAKDELNSLVATARDDMEKIQSATAGGSGAGSGGGSPPVATAGGDEELPNPNDANSWENLAKAEKDAKTAAQEGIQTLLDLSAAADKTSDASRFAYAAMQLQNAANKAIGTSAESSVLGIIAQVDANTKAADASRMAYTAGILLKAGLAASGEAADDAAPKLVALSAAASDLTSGASRALGRWRVLTAQVQLWAGFLGSAAMIGEVAAWHVALDGVIEVLALWVPALLTAGAGLLGFGAAGYKSAKQIAEQMVNVYDVSTALQKTIPPLQKAMGGLADAVRPQVYELFGDALDALNTKSGVFSQLIQQTGVYLDRFAARVVVAMQQGGGGLATFFQTGEKDLALIGKGFDSLGSIILKFIQATALTHIAEDLAAIGDAVLGFAAAIVKVVPTPLLAAILGLHGFLLWGGVMVSTLQKIAVGFLGILGRIPAFNSGILSIADALNATDVKLVKIAQSAPEVTAALEAMATGGATKEGLAGLQVQLEKTGLSAEQYVTAIGPNAVARMEQFSKGLEDSGKSAVAFGIAAGATDEELSKIATSSAEAAGSSGLLSSALSLVTKVPVWGWVLAGAVALGGLVYWLATTKDATQKWIDSLNTAITKLGSFGALNGLVTNFGKVTVSLKAANEELAKTPPLASGQASKYGVMSTAAIQASTNIGALTAEQKKLGTEMDAETGHVADISRAYGTTFVGSLELARLAGVNLNDLFTTNAKTWADAAQQIAGLVTGYEAMGQQMGTVGSDLNALSVAESTQEKAMSSLNSAYDSWTKIVGGAPATFITLAQGLQQFTTDAKAAGATMTGLTPASLTLQSDFQSNYNNVEQLFDAMRSSEALTGSGGFTSFVKDAVSALIPLAGNNKAAAAQVSALAQEAGGPATTSLKSLQEWAGKVKDPMVAMQKATNQAAVASSNLSQDASRLANTLASDLNGQMATAIENVTGVQKAFETYGTAVEKDGATSKTAATDRQSLLKSLTEELHSRSQAEQVLSTYTGQLTFNAGATVKAASAQKDIATELQNAHVPASRIASDMDAVNFAISQYPKNSPQVHSAMKTLTDDLTASGVNGKVATKQVQDYANQVGVSGSQASKAKGPTKDYGDAVGGIPGKLSSLSKLSSDDKTWPKPKEGFWTQYLLNPYKATLGQMFSTMGTLSATGWKQLTNGFNQYVVDPIDKFFDSSIPSLITHGASDFVQFWSQQGQDFNKDVIQPVNKFFSSTIPSLITHGASSFVQFWSGQGQDFNKDVVQPVNKWFTSTIPSNLSQDASNFSSHWAAVWSSFNKNVVQPVAHWFSSTMASNLSTDAKNFAAHWVNVWDSFNTNVVQKVSHYFSSTVPGYLSTDAKNFAAHWVNLWNSFNTNVVEKVSHWFSSTVPGYLSTDAKNFANHWESLWNSFNNDVAKPIGNWFTKTLPSAISSGIKTGLDTAIHGINTVIGFINNDVLHGLPGNLHIPTINPLAGGGPVRMASGSVPGTGDEDGTHIIAMGGEYMLRKPARMALEQKFGPNFLNTLNHADTLLGAGSRGNAASQKNQTPGRSYATGGGILGSVEGFFSGLGSGLTDAAKSLSKYVTGGVGALEKLAGEGAEKIFDAIWTATVQPMVNQVNGDNIPGGIIHDGANDLKGGIEGFLTSQDAAAKKTATAMTSGGIGTAGVANSSAEAALQSAAAKAGWTGAEWQALYQVEMDEAGFSLIAKNPGSGAYGMAQFINGPSEYAQYGGNSTTAAGQAVAMVNYIKQRYGDPESALAHENAYHWYASGGPIGMASGSTVPAGMDTAQSWEYWRSQLVKSAADQNISFWDLNEKHLPTGKGGATPDQWAAWYADLGILQTNQKALYSGGASAIYQKVASTAVASPATMDPNLWGQLRNVSSNQNRWLRDTPTPPSSQWGNETKVPWPSKYKTTAGKTPGHIPPAAWAAWKFQHGPWNTATTDSLNLYNIAGNAENAWKAQYQTASTGTGTGTTGSQPGPGGVTVLTPGPGSGNVSVDLSSLILGGPAMPVSAASVIPSLSGTGNGFSGGGVLGDIASRFAVGGNIPYPVLARVGSPLANSGQSAVQDLPRTISAAASQPNVGMQVESLTINNPVAEKPSDSIARSANRLSFMAGRGF
jgi:hypothetical protein